VGDPSDNYKGVNGIGPKTAIKLINEFGEVTSIYKNLKKIPLQTREKLEKDKDSALISHKLATIVKDVSVKLDLDKAGKWDIDSQKVLDEFARLGFKTLAERVKKVGQQIDSEKQLNLL
jgi:DNA polymerase-1